MMLLQIVIFAAIAVFVLLRLYHVLGKDVGAPPPKSVPKQAPVNHGSRPAAKPGAEPIPLRVAFDGPAAAGLEAIRSVDGRFDPQRFLQGARIAYERIVEAYSRGDKKSLKGLLKPDVYSRYAEAIDARAKAGRELETKIIQIKKATIKEAALKGRQASILVAFSAEISTRESARDDKEEPRVEIATTTEEWTFVRDMRSRDPNWKLAGVASIA